MRKKSLDSTPKRLEIFVILSMESREFHVGKTTAEDCKGVYRQHAAGQRATTRAMFEKAEAQQKFPVMYRLESVFLSEEEAYQRCLAWIRFFLDQGFESCDHTKVNAHAMRPTKETIREYERIKGKTLDEIFVQENRVVFDYKRRKKTEKTPPCISISVSPEEYIRIKNRADRFGERLSAYCKKQSLHGRIIRMDKPVFWDILGEIRGIRNVVQVCCRQVGRDENETSKELVKLEELVTGLAEIESNLSREIHELKLVLISDRWKEGQR